MSDADSSTALLEPDAAVANKRLKRLAVFTPQLGTFTETFIRRHIEDVLPNRTVAVARHSSHPSGGFWSAGCPVLFLDAWESRRTVRILRGLGSSNAWFRSNTIAGFLRKHRVNIVLGEYLDQFVDFVPMLDSLRMPYVVQAHGIDASAALRTPGMAERYHRYKTARFVLTRCEFHRQRLIALGLPPEKVLVNPGGIDIPERLPARGPRAAKRFLAIGRMAPKKGPIYLLEAFRLCAEADAEITLDYVGDGELLSAVTQFVDATGLTERVRLHVAAPTELKEQLLRDCGIFVQHSVTDPYTGDEEGLPASIQEAMAHGMAVVSTRHSGIREMVEHGSTGLLVDECDTKGMADAMTRLSRGEDNAEWQQMGINGREKAARLYSWSGERARLMQYLGRTDADGQD